jgi:hypothetical protein
VSLILGQESGSFVTGVADNVAKFVTADHRARPDRDRDSSPPWSTCSRRAGAEVSG